MKIFLAGSIVGGRENAQTYAQIVEYLLPKGHEVPSAHVAQSDVLDWEKKNPPSLIYERDIYRLGSRIRGHHHCGIDAL